MILKMFKNKMHKEFHTIFIVIYEMNNYIVRSYRDVIVITKWRGFYAFGRGGGGGLKSP